MEKTKSINLLDSKIIKNLPYKKYKNWYLENLIFKNEFITNDMFFNCFKCDKTMENIKKVIPYSEIRLKYIEYCHGGYDYNNLLY